MRHQFLEKMKQNNRRHPIPISKAQCEIRKGNLISKIDTLRRTMGNIDDVIVWLDEYHTFIDIRNLKDVHKQLEALESILYKELHTLIHKKPKKY